MVMKVKIINKSQNPNPSYATDGSAGMDLSANNFNTIAIAPNERCIIHTGIFIELPENYEAQIRPRSGLALKKGLTVANTPGTIDSDFRGEICVILHNISEDTQYVAPGERIAQMVIAKYERVEWNETEEMSETIRGEGGFGSTGI
jgi:dUTP pyrophosphatase